MNKQRKYLLLMLSWSIKTEDSCQKDYYKSQGDKHEKKIYIKMQYLLARPIGENKI